MRKSGAESNDEISDSKRPEALLLIRESGQEGRACKEVLWGGEMHERVFHSGLGRGTR